MFQHLRNGHQFIKSSSGSLDFDQKEWFSNTRNAFYILFTVLPNKPINGTFPPCKQNPDGTLTANATVTLQSVMQTFLKACIDNQINKHRIALKAKEAW